MIVASGFDDHAILHEVNRVGMRDGLQPMRDDDNGPIFEQACDRRLDMALGFAVQRCGRLIEQHDRCVAKKGAGDRDALALTAGQLNAVLPDRGIVTFGEARDEFVRVRGAGRSDDLGIGRSRLADGDIVADRPMKQKHILTDIGHAAAQ